MGKRRKVPDIFLEYVQDREANVDQAYRDALCKVLGTTQNAILDVLAIRAPHEQAYGRNQFASIWM